MRVSRVGREMNKVVVRFFDDETLEGVVRDLDFDEPDFLVEVDDAGGLENNETAWIPLTAVKWVELPRDPNLASETPTRKVATRFLDGEVLRGHLDGTLEHDLVDEPDLRHQRLDDVAGQPARLFDRDSFGEGGRCSGRPRIFTAQHAVVDFTLHHRSEYCKVLRRIEQLQAGARRPRGWRRATAE